MTVTLVLLAWATSGRKIIGDRLNLKRGSSEGAEMVHDTVVHNIIAGTNSF
jgi:hypothetical protein